MYSFIYLFILLAGLDPDHSFKDFFFFFICFIDDTGIGPCLKDKKFLKTTMSGYSLLFFFIYIFQPKEKEKRKLFHVTDLQFVCLMFAFCPYGAKLIFLLSDRKVGGTAVPSCLLGVRRGTGCIC
jgi:hypothetical protein